MKPSDCPRFDRCNAPICPLDEHRLKSCYLSGEAVCFYLRAMGKPGADEYLGSDPVLALARERALEIFEKWPTIRRKSERAWETGFQADNLPSGRPKVRAGATPGGMA